MSTVIPIDIAIISATIIDHLASSEEKAQLAGALARHMDAASRARNGESRPHRPAVAYAPRPDDPVWGAAQRMYAGASRAQLFKWLECCDAQCMESTRWPGSAVRRLLLAQQALLAKAALQQSEEYKKACWGPI